MNSHEIWQVEVQGHVYEANIDEIIEWINEGSVLPDDKVRKGSLRWLKAEKVPELFGHFNLKNFGNASAVNVTLTDANSTANKPETESKDLAMPESFSEESNRHIEAKPETLTVETKPDNAVAQTPEEPQPVSGKCVVHPNLDAKYFCGTCLTLFCKNCPDSFGGNVKICIECGAMCRIYAGEESLVKSVGAINKPYPRNEFEINNDSDLTLGDFELADFGKALVYPFKFKASLIFGAVVFMLFTLGQSVSAFGVSMYFAAIVCFMLANMLTFGCLANTLDNFSRGKTGANFMPGFDDFTLWDDVIHPFLLSFGVYFISFALLLVLLGGAFWSASDSENKIEADKQKILSVVLPSTIEISNSAETLSQNVQTLKPSSSEEKSANVNQSDDEKIARLEQSSMKTASELQRLKTEISQNVQARLQAQSVKTEEKETGLFNRTTGTVLRLSLVFSVPVFLALLWGIFYFPVACIIAGYTKSFAAVLNPSVGFDTIKRLGLNYWKIIGVFLISAASLIGLNSFLQTMLAPFDLPYLGNLLATVFVSLFAFYLWIVFSAALGIMLFRNSAKLNFRPN